MNLNHIKVVVVATWLIFLGCSGSKNISKATTDLAASDLKPFGRSVLNDSQNLELISSAAHVGLTFEGTECRVYASHAFRGGHNYLQYELDGVYQQRVRVGDNLSSPVIITALNGGKHTLWLYKATEAHTGALVVGKVSATNVKAIQRPSAPQIEFIGNSITCGAAADPSETPCGSGVYHDQHNAFYAYGPRVARALKANYVISAVSGIGVYRNWNSDGPSMPQVFDKADFQDNNKQLWDFKRYKPAVVSIALGTNDFSRGDGVRKRLPFDSAAFVDAYIKFVQVVKSKYSSAQIALLSSAMVGGKDRLLLQNCLTAVKGSIDELYPADKKVAVYFFQPMQPHGCGGHPSVEDHEILAKELVPFFKDLLTGVSK